VLHTNKTELLRTAFLTQVCSILANHNFMAEWCCTLDDYCSLLSYVPIDFNSVDFSSVLTCLYVFLL
jgi:hypothetical protein